MSFIPLAGARGFVEELPWILTTRSDRAFAGFSTNEQLSVFINTGFAGSVVEARQLLGRLLSSKVLTCRVRGKEVRYYINAGLLTESGASSQIPSAPHRRTSQPDRPSPDFSF